MVRKWDILKGDNTGARAGKSEAGGSGGKRPSTPPIFADQFTHRCLYRDLHGLPYLSLVLV